MYYNKLYKITKAGRIGLATGLGGMLTSITSDPLEAEVSERCRQLLAQLAKSGRFEVVAVISDRAALESRRLLGLSELLYIGNCGLETLPPHARATEVQTVKAALPYRPKMAAILEKVKARLSNYESTILEQLGEGNWSQKLVYENKETSARIHYHSIENVRIVRQILLEQLGQVAQEAGLRVVENRKAVEVRPPLEVNKGSALLRLKEAYQLNGLIFLGDDLTDLEGFRTLRLLEEQSRRESTPAFSTPFYSLAVGVSTPEMPPALALAAHLLVDGVNGVEKFLASLFAAIL